MKKILVTIIALVMVISFSACGGSEKEEPADNKSEENLTAYEYYHDAVRKFNDKDSYDLDMDTTVKISSVDYNLEMKMGGNIKSSGVNVDEEVMIYDLYNQMGTTEEKSFIKGFFKDGYLYSDVDGEKSKTETDFTEVEEKFNSQPNKFSSDMVEDQSVNDIEGGKELHMKLNPEVMDDVTFGMFGGISNLGEMMDLEDEVTIKSVSFTVTINEDGDITNSTLVAAYDVAIDGESGSISVTLTEAFNQLGGVKLETPEDLSEYE